MVKNKEIRNMLDSQVLTFMCHALFFKTFFLSGNSQNVYISYTCSIKIINQNFFSFLFISGKSGEMKKASLCYDFKISSTDL